MASVSPEILRALENQSSWLSGEHQAAHLAKLEAFVAKYPENVGSWVLDDLAVDPERARAIVQSLEVATRSGLTALNRLGEDRVELQTADGARLALGVLCFQTPVHPKGHPEDLQRLTALLDATFQGRQYALYLRRGIPAGFDPGPVARAAHLWLAAIDRGEWKGRHAIYEDDAVALELTLVKRRAEGSGGRVMTVGPVNALERLGEVDTQVVDLTTRHTQQSDLPLVVALSAQPAWRVPRGYVEQLLYGTADRVDVDGGPYRATFTANGRSLFSDPACSRLAQLWWIEGAHAQQPFAFRIWAHDNPWTTSSELMPNVDAERFHADPPEGNDSRRRSLSWSAHDTRVWLGDPD